LYGKIICVFSEMPCFAVSFSISVQLNTFRKLQEFSFVGFDILIAASTKMAVLWIVAPCSLVEGATTQKTAIFNLVFFLTWNGS
jgi:tryptophan-rich sensory protein